MKFVNQDVNQKVNLSVVLQNLVKGLYPARIAKKYGVSRAYISKLMVNLKKKKFISKEGYGVWKVSKRGKDLVNKLLTKSSLRMRKPTRLHNLKIKFPLLKDNPKSVWDKKVKINNWVKSYSKIDFPISITVERTSKSIVAHFHQFETTQEMFFTDFLTWIMRGTDYLYYWLKEKGIMISKQDALIIHQEVANISKEYDDKLDDKLTNNILLGRKAKSIFPTSINASAWLDRSKGSVEIETNDLIYEEKLLLMPETIHELSRWTENIELYDKNIVLHLKVLNKMDKTLDLIRKNLKK